MKKKLNMRREPGKETKAEGLSDFSPDNAAAPGSRVLL